MPEPTNELCADCETSLGGDLIGADYLLKDLEAMDEDRAKLVLKQMGKDLGQQLDEIKRRCKQLGMKI